LEGHFLGYKLLRITRSPLKELPRATPPLMRAFLRRSGAPLRQRLYGLKIILSAILGTIRNPREKSNSDPVIQTRRNLESNPTRLNELETAIKEEISKIVDTTVQVVLS